MRVFTNTEGVDGRASDMGRGTEVGVGEWEGGVANISMFDILQPSLFTRRFTDKIQN